MTRFFSLLRGAPWATALLLAGLLAPRAASASHAMGADMSYVNVAPGFYLVVYRFYRDCSGIGAPANYTLNYEATGCGPNNTANAGGQLTLSQRSFVVANPYCPRQNALSVCDPNSGVPSNGLPNFHIYTYSGLLTLGAGPNAQCTEWVLSAGGETRTSTRNLSGAEYLYTEVRLDTKLVPDDSSPVFPATPGFQPLIFTCDTTYKLITSQIIDPDNVSAGNYNLDSLAYRSVTPLSASGVPIAYANGHSLTNPVRVWNGRPPTTPAGSPPVNFPFSVNPVTGAIQFTPGLAIIGSPSDADNKFALSIAIESWRSINGIRRKISTVRRDIQVVIFRCPTRPAAPQIDNNGDSVVVHATPLGTLIIAHLTDTIDVYALTNNLIQVPVHDSQGDSIRPYFRGWQLPSISTIQVSQQVIRPGIYTSAIVELGWNPDMIFVGGYFPIAIQLTDNGCPLASEGAVRLVLHAVLPPLGLPAGAVKRQVLRATPNPFAGATRLSVPTSATAATVGIYDLTGRLIDNLLVPAGAAGATWHAPATLPAGVYVARYRSAAGQQTARLVKE